MRLMKIPQALRAERELMTRGQAQANGVVISQKQWRLNTGEENDPEMREEPGSELWRSRR